MIEGIKKIGKLTKEEKLKLKRDRFIGLKNSDIAGKKGCFGSSKNKRPIFKLYGY